MQDIYKEFRNIVKNKDKTEQFCIQMQKWLFEFQPTHFVSIQFPTAQRSDNLEKSVYRLKGVMKYFEKQLNYRHWYKKHLPFVSFAENTSGMWHFHIYLKNDRYDNEKIDNAFVKTTKTYGYSPDIINVKQITYTPEKVFNYGNKEIQVDIKGNYEDFRFMASTDLFYVNTEWFNPIKNYP